MDKQLPRQVNIYEHSTTTLVLISHCRDLFLLFPAFCLDASLLLLAAEFLERNRLSNSEASVMDMRQTKLWLHG
jgi:hypothetical protein